LTFVKIRKYDLDNLRRAAPPIYHAALMAHVLRPQAVTPAKAGVSRESRHRPRSQLSLGWRIWCRWPIRTSRGKVGAGFPQKAMRQQI